ncbi:nad dependent epimerase dehydratase [Diplodia corticola]|uniref:Nad dependent epimerase dehydratase n=1 Tax=Diplodia corticola TaxID=236234 RepID=A0A1J9RSN3_9PEZI|nr:nad dependent epimerase dehydratase [Diplodia corticola]OJD35563.1 nad dependent epimerase dehydratase [Diplodia corticola]
MAHTILVTGAAGRQGGATVRALLDIASDRNIAVTIHALVRDPTSDASKALASLGASVELFVGNFDDIASLHAAAKACTAVFINVMPDKGAPDTELRHARAILAACKAAGTVTRAVYSSASIIGCERAHAELDAWPGMAWYMRSKKAIEDEVLAAGFLADASTLLRPAMFFTNFVSPVAAAMYPNLATTGELHTALDPDLKLSCLDPDMIGRFAARALVERDGDFWRGRIVPLAREHLTMPQIADKLTAAVGDRKEVKVVPFSEEELAAKRTVFVNSELFRNEFRGAVDLDEVRSYGVHLGSWDEFARREKKAIEVALGLA